MSALTSLFRLRNHGGMLAVIAGTFHLIWLLYTQQRKIKQSATYPLLKSCGLAFSKTHGHGRVAVTHHSAFGIPMNPAMVAMETVLQLT